MLNSAIYKKDSVSGSVWTSSRKKDTSRFENNHLNSCLVNRIKEKNHDHLNCYKAFDKIQYSFTLILKITKQN